MRYIICIRIHSSAGQSSRLITGMSRVQVPADPFGHSCRCPQATDILLQQSPGDPFMEFAGSGH